ncbi:thiamine biosynthesis protein ThiS [Methylocella silvestris BL2]|uniref:Thiamine biosynthesis protein ThiS n=1 Tax=Methylocella silvestris (strain DSM 15510 / CIP 108128 / LMG 27833 / NCIMB 13906 / BL2) TaxID=395965 RepID=B8ESP5_METSB|nr:sulfur carrier protein ThiS [Methylocella silvestris]ACK50380.1 thiamine biosynthesis protein ThiS [Methylocella silvestris BL2]
MKIEVNGKTLEVAATTLAALLNELDYDEGHVATALNRGFVRKTQRAQTKIKEGDAVEIVSPRQGG